MTLLPKQLAAPFAAVAFGVAALGVSAAAVHAAPVGDPRLQGFWNIDAEDRSARADTFKAKLTPAGEAIQRRNAETQRNRLAHGEAVGLGSYTCGKQGVPFIYGTSEPFLLVLTPDEVVQIAERRQMIPRHFYTDGRTWPDLSKMPPSVSGYSIAHWEGKDLVIETRGMPPGGVNGGGLKGPKTVLTERVSLDAKGNRLTWSYTWVDPDLLAEPLTFALKYDRAPKHTYALTHPCDPNKDAGRTVSAPKQD